MKTDTLRRAIRLVGLVLPMSWAASAVAGQMQAAAMAESFGVSVSTSTVNQKTPYAVLPTGIAMATDQGQSVDVAGLVTAQDAFAIVTGDADPTSGSSAVSSATLGAVSLLGGLISTDGVVAVASSSRDATGARSDAEGSSLSNLVVNGVAVADPAPNTRMNLPGVGYVILNEQRRSGDGWSSSGITVNMIHVVLQTVTGGDCTLLGCTPEVTTTTGEIIVGSATSTVN